MANLNAALQQLRQERKLAQAQIEKLDQAISVIEGLAGGSSSRGRTGGRRAGRSLSAVARKRLSEAQRARWARVRKQKPGAGAGPKPVAAGKRTISPAARRRIAAAQRARWARFRAQKKAA